MAHDYANKPKKRQSAARRTSPPSNTRGGRKPAPRVRRGLPLKAILSLIILAGFGYGLYKLAFVRPDPSVSQQTARQQSSQPATVSPPKKAAEKVVEKEDEGFRFYDMLPKSEVVPPKVEAYVSTPKSAKNHSKYLLQAGSFRDPADADSLKARLILLGMPGVTTSKSTSSSGAIWYRVRVGPFVSRSKLNKAQDQMVRMRLQPMQVKIP